MFRSWFLHRPDFLITVKGVLFWFALFFSSFSYSEWFNWSTACRSGETLLFILDGCISSGLPCRIYDASFCEFESGDSIVQYFNGDNPCSVGTWNQDLQTCFTCSDNSGLSAGFRSFSGIFPQCVNGCQIVPVGVSLGTLEGTWHSNYQYTGLDCSPGMGEEVSEVQCPDGWTLTPHDLCVPDPGATSDIDPDLTTCEMVNGECIEFDPGVPLPDVDPENGGTGQDSEPAHGSDGFGSFDNGATHGGQGASSSGQSSFDIDGDGDVGSCDPDHPECSQVNLGTVDGGLVCGSPPVCDGDDIACAILMQNYLSRCPNESFSSSGSIDLSTTLQTAESDLDIAWQEIQSQVDDYFDFNLSGGGSITNNIQQVKGVDFDFSIARFLPELSALPPLIVAMAWLIAAGIVLSSR